METKELSVSVIEGNKLIAEFMGGWYETKDQPNPYWENIWSEKIYPDTKDLKYHKSFDWLMPVVEKIESLGYEVKIGRISCQVHEILKQNSPISSLVCGNISKKIDLVYDVCVNFIQWYNQNKHN